ncbi:MAG: ATP-dependent phosphofructokinase / diphosphate-dependent phosphofructokinase [Clostridiales bacterium]|nr:ATP-dependent phosphofructokinase / diphosphate-dependent phosphofructokinase [Clostridiales bacterium]
MSANLIVVHGGGPTAVINASLKGIIDEAKKYNEIDGIYGSVGGVDGIFAERFADLRAISGQALSRLSYTPGSFIGSSRKHLEPEDYETIVAILRRNNIKYLLFTGGNGSMDTCNKIHHVAAQAGDINVIGIPKTVDNDLANTDHAPGYGSAARYAAVSACELGIDVASLPVHISVIEFMGRNAGWITAASALARCKQGDAPHLIYLPERPFVEEEFLHEIERLHKEIGGAVVAVSEGLVGPDGNPLVQPNNMSRRDAFSNDVSVYLARLISDKLHIRARSEKPGLLGRASIAHQSSVDRREAEMVGAAAVKAAVEGLSGYMAALKRLSTEPYSCTTELVSIDLMSMTERHVPDEFIDPSGHDVTPAFIEYCKPLIGDAMPVYATNRDLLY